VVPLGARTCAPRACTDRVTIQRFPGDKGAGAGILTEWVDLSTTARCHWYDPERGARIGWPIAREAPARWLKPMRVSLGEFCCLSVVAGVIVAGLVSGHSVCLWRAALGFPCPGCGMTRALLSLVRGDLQAAWQFNPNSFVVAPILLGAAIRHVWPPQQNQHRRRLLGFVLLASMATPGFTTLAWTRSSPGFFTAAF
jgi:hypothetical protein